MYSMLYNPIQCYVTQFNVIKEHLDRSQLKMPKSHFDFKNTIYSTETFSIKHILIFHIHSKKHYLQ